MNSYENEIMELLIGDTPKKKYEYLIELIHKNNLISHLITNRRHAIHTQHYKYEIDILGKKYKCFIKKTEPYDNIVYIQTEVGISFWTEKNKLSLINS